MHNYRHLTYTINNQNNYDNYLLTFEAVKLLWLYLPEHTCRLSELVWRKEEGGRRWVQMNISIEIVLYYSILIKFNTMEIERKEFAIHSEAQSLVNKSFRRVRGAGAISHVYQLRTCWLTQTEKALLLAISHQCSGESRNIKGNRSKLRKQ